MHAVIKFDVSKNPNKQQEQNHFYNPSTADNQESQ